MKRPAGMTPRGVFSAAAQSCLSSNPFTTYYNLHHIGEVIRQRGLIVFSFSRKMFYD
ncbi:hypothetical protein HanRHA438_Chr16g0767781 [Helianthus annuus]|nr:hypothetical protein HanRHA438_Chr16g0767781 [Helianthus annuus]